MPCRRTQNTGTGLEQAHVHNCDWARLLYKTRFLTTQRTAAARDELRLIEELLRHKTLTVATCPCDTGATQDAGMIKTRCRGSRGSCRQMSSKKLSLCFVNLRPSMLATVLPLRPRRAALQLSLMLHYTKQQNSEGCAKSTLSALFTHCQPSSHHSSSSSKTILDFLAGGGADSASSL